MYRILGRSPHTTDCNIKHLKLFEAHYAGADVKFTELCDALLRKNPLGPPVVYTDDDDEVIYNDNGTVGMIELEKRKTVKRLRPAGSPDRKKSR
jgi:hypothetical protein